MHTTLIDTASLEAHLDDDNLVIVDCRFDLMKPGAGVIAWKASHIPNARYAHLDRDLASPITPQTGRHPLPEVETLVSRLESWGIGNDTQVVAYDDAGGGYAVRLWWMLRWLGHNRAAVLDGGWQRWIADNRQVDAREPGIRQRRFETSVDDSQWLDTPAIKANLADGSIVLVDARTAERFRGEAEPIDPVAGHVPGAVNYPLQQNLDANGCFLPRAELRQHYRAVLGDIDYRSVVHMCGSGVTACHNLLAMEHAGLAGSRLYPGSWSEWIRTENPAE